MSTLRTFAAVVGAASALGALSAASAAAYVAPGATIVSASLARLEQADDATIQVALSGDGRYAAITTRARNFFADDDADPDGQFRAGGIFRRDLRDGALELVAHGELRADADPDTVLVRGAINPSLSADGRFVVFSSGRRLVPEDTNGNVDVYVRDMTLPIGAAGAYELISKTADGQPAQYAPLPDGQDRPGVNLGSDVTARNAISADGRLVVFKTADVVTNLPAGGAAGTPGQQLFVRDRVAGTTRLVTRDRTTGEPAGGALGGAVISADGGTVAWAGRNAPSQTEMLASEGANPSLDYYLWRHIADGDQAVTRRITGYADPADPSCAPGTSIIEDPALSGPCYGPLVAGEGALSGLINTPPALSADGMRVAYLTSTAARGVLTSGTATDLFVVDMNTGASRRASTTEVTRDGGTTAATNAAIDGIALSGDGRWIAMTTLRTQQLLPTFALTGTPRSAATARDVYLIDLSGRTLERASTGLLGADTDGPASALPAIDSGGRRVAFISAATNLFYGDANNRADAFVVDRLDAPPAIAPEPEPVTAGPGATVTAPEPPAPTRLTVRARPGKHGTVTLRVQLPEAARGTVAARGKLRTAAGKPTGRARVLASAKLKAARRGTVTVTLRIAPKLRAKLRLAGRLTASARVTVTGRSGTEYLGRATVEFRP